MNISELKEQDCPIWDAYVQNSSNGLPMHLSGWRNVMSKTYGYETHYLMATEGGKVVGVFPLYILRSFLMGNSMKTMPGGLCASDSNVATALIDQGKQICMQRKIDRLVLQDIRHVWLDEQPTTYHHVHWTVDVSIGIDDMWKRLHKNDRRQVRMARKNGLTVEIDRCAKRLGHFYDVMSRFTHYAGTPMFGFDFLENVVEIFPEGFSIAIVYKGKQPVGAYFQLEMDNTIYGTWGATLHEYLRERAVYLAYWEMLVDAFNNGYQNLDMGRSPVDSNISKFKGRWGGESNPVYQQVVTTRNLQSAITMNDRVETDIKFQYFMRLWSKLPSPVVHFLGPKLRRHLPFA
jgi:FemAB-related protein (PEP-CTERM system-associated)